ncbi:MAG: CHRD domain-containing protein [Vicinamibacteraceae bacterium]
MTRVSVVLTTVLTCAFAAPAGAASYFTANLSGTQEVPSNGSTASGFGRVTLNDAETQITASVYYSGLGSNVTIGHLHGPASPGGNAAIVFDLSPTPGVTSGSVVNAVFAVTPTQAANIKAGYYYFNIHTVNFTGGEIRGQATVDPVQISRLTSAQESPANGSTATGTGAVSINAAGTQALVSMTWSGLSGPATMGHAHFGNPKVSGPDVLDLSPAAATAGSVVDAIWNISPLQGAALRRGQYYLNIHTAANPGGEIRGQILRRRATNETMLDQDGDGRADLSIARASGGAVTWWSLLSETNTVNYAQFGLNTDFDNQRLLMGDFDGDGRADRALFRTTGQVGFWILYATGSSEYLAFGIPGDDPRVIGDYDADGITDLAIFRTSTNTWWIRRSTDGAINAFQWGLDFPNPGDHDGDGRNDFTDQQGGIWWTLFSPGSTYRIQPFGNGNFFGTPGDFDGDGKTDIAGTNSEGSNTVWYYISSLLPTQPVYATREAFGPSTGQVRVQGDYDGDGKTDVAIWISATRTYWVLNSSGGIFIRQWGLSTDAPIAGYNNR